MNTLLITHLSTGLIAFILGAFTHLLFVNMKRSKVLKQEVTEQEARDEEKGD